MRCCANSDVYPGPKFLWWFSGYGLDVPEYPFDNFAKTNALLKKNANLITPECDYRVIQNVNPKNSLIKCTAANNGITFTKGYAYRLFEKPVRDIKLETIRYASQSAKAILIRCCVNSDAYPTPHFEWNKVAYRKYSQLTSDPEETKQTIEKLLGIKIPVNCNYRIIDPSSLESIHCSATNGGLWSKSDHLTRISAKLLTKKSPIKELELETLSFDNYEPIEVSKGVDLGKKYIIRCCAKDGVYPAPEFKWFQWKTNEFQDVTEAVEERNKYLGDSFKSDLVVSRCSLMSFSVDDENDALFRCSASNNPSEIMVTKDVSLLVRRKLLS